MRDPIWKEIVSRRATFLSRAFVKPFLGFAGDQLKRMTGRKGRGQKGQRPGERTEAWLRRESCNAHTLATRMQGTAGGRKHYIALVRSVIS